MAEKTETIKIEIDGREALVKHIQDLQYVITSKNAEIEKLKAENEQFKADPTGFLDSIQKQSYEKGFNECRRHVRARMGDTLTWLELDNSSIF